MRDIRQSTAGAASSEAMRLYCCCCAFLPGLPQLVGHGHPPSGRPFAGFRTWRMMAGILLQAKRTQLR
jgi:hypothetical protein